MNPAAVAETTGETVIWIDEDFGESQQLTSSAVIEEGGAFITDYSLYFHLEVQFYDKTFIHFSW
jgi:hypothetical protein